MEAKKTIAAGLAAVLMLSLFPAPIHAAEWNQADSVNHEGVWMTEIYQNDVTRNSNDSRRSSGYEDVLTFNTEEDMMEFVEIASTHEEAISLNEVYDFYYNDTKMTVTTMDDSDEVIVEKGQSVVLWNYRSDLGITMPTEEEFRTEMRVPDEAMVLKAVSGGNWAANDCSFAVKTKDGTAVSEFVIPSNKDTYTQDGFSVELQMPDMGSRMLVYREKNAPSAGYVFASQLNGLIPTEGTEDSAEGLYLTELRPNDINRCANYGSSQDQDLMECIEITNTTGEDVVLNRDYVLKYFVKEGSRKVFDICQYDAAAENCIGSSENCVVPAGGTAIIWNYRVLSFPADVMATFTSFPTMEEFRAAYGIAQEIPVYLWTNQNGMGNNNRGVEIYAAAEDGSQELESSYIWVGSTECKDNKSAHLAVNPEGPQMLLATANGTTGMGTVSDSQLTYLIDDGSAIELRPALASDRVVTEDEVIPSSIAQGEELRLNFYYASTGSLPKKTLATYYRVNGEGSWIKSVEGGSRVPYLYESILSADVLFDADYVEFYVKAANAYRSTICGPYTVEVTKKDQTAPHTNLSQGEQVRGTVSITASEQIVIDGEEQVMVPMLDDGAYFSFYADGRDSYFKNALTTTDNEWITAIGKWQYAISNGQAHHIDSSYFTYNEANQSYDVTLRFWAGTYGTTVDEYLYPEANREDFKVSQLALKIPGGNTYYPTAIGPASFEGVDTSAKTNLSTAYDAVHSIGDSANMCPYMDVSFSVPASEVTAVGAEIDTTAMADGSHTLKLTGSDQEITFIVDNTAPVVEMGVEKDAVLTGSITLDPQAYDENLADVTVVLDGAIVETPYTVTARELGEGSHVLSVLAEDAAGNQTSDSVFFTVEDVDMQLLDSSTTDVTDTGAVLSVQVQSGADAEATFYAAEQIADEHVAVNTIEGIVPYVRYTLDVGNVSSNTVLKAVWDGQASGTDDTHAAAMFVLNTATDNWDRIGTVDSEGSIHASFSSKNHVKNGVATIVIQCSADSALPDLNSETDGSANAEWDGTGVPENYDFSFAWITDTQYYAEQWQHNFLTMNNYIVDNAEELGIKYVIHTGDIVDDWDMVYEWENASDAMAIFDEAGMPYGVLGGNHDVAAGLEDNEYYYTYFGEDRFQDQPTYGGSYSNNLGHYDLLSENGQDFIIVYMSWNIYQEEIDWMNSVLAQYSDRKAILCFHPYTNVKESDSGLLDYYGVLIQKEVVAKNPNVFAVLNGHYHGSSYQTVRFDDDGDGLQERTVYQICTDYQSGFEGGSAYIKFLYFDLDGDKVYLNSYSPYFDDFNYYDGTGVDAPSELADQTEDGIVYRTGIDSIVLDVDFDTDAQTILTDSFQAYVCTDAVLGTAPVEEGIARLEWSTLAPETDYAWYAVVENVNSGVLETPVCAFTTETDPVAAVEKQIDAIGEVTLGSAAAIDAARSAYEALSPEQQAQVENIQTLLDAEAAIAKLKADAEAAEEGRLALAKYNALTELEEYAATRNPATDEEADRIEQILRAARTVINEAADAEQIAQLLAQAKADMDAAACPSECYTDVQEGTFYHEAVDFMVRNGYMNGMSDTHFGVNSPLNRAQLVTILYRMAGEPDVDGMVNPFADVPADEWYTDAVIWAYNTQVVNGVSDTAYAPAQNITREQLAAMLYRYSGSAAVPDDQLSAYADAQQVSDFAREAMNWAVANDIIRGMDHVTLAPQAEANRAQACTMLFRWAE